MRKFKIILSSFFLLFSACRIFYGNYQNEAHVATVNNNVCKKLTQEVVLYAIFVDSRYTNPWTSYDISSTTDSINKAIYWIEKQAGKRNVFLKI